MKTKIVVDSACDCLAADGTQLEIVSLSRTHTALTDAAVDSAVQSWLDAFGDAEYIFCMTVSGRLADSYASALQAKELYEKKYPNRHVCLLDSRTAGPEMTLMLERAQQLLEIGMPLELVCRAVCGYRDHTRMLYALESAGHITDKSGMNGVGTMGIRLIGRVSRCGTLHSVKKIRGKKNTLCALLEQMEQMGYCGGKVILSHCGNLEGAVELMRRIRAQYGAVDVRIFDAGETCSRYARKGALMVGMEVSAVREASAESKTA